MGILEKLFGTMENIFKIGKSNTVEFRNNNGRIEAKNSTDTYYREIAHQDVTKNDTGFPYENRFTEATITFNPSTRVFSIAPSGSSFSFYVRGTRVTKTTAQTINIPNTSGRYFLYFQTEAGTLVYTTTPWDIFNDVPIAMLYFNASNLKYLLFEERHSSNRNMAWHAWAHRNIGTLYDYGLTLSGYTLSDGTSDSSVQVEVSDGSIWDEDIRMIIVHDATPTNEFEQYLVKPAQIPVFYREGADGLWNWDTATDYFVKNTTSGRVNYNLYNGSSWVQQETPDTNFVAYWIFATNNMTPGQSIISIQGQRADTKLQDALENNTLSNLSLGILPSVEFKALYKVIVSTRNNHTNSRKMSIEHVEDLREVANAGGGDHSPLSHASLADLGSSGHPGSAIQLDTTNFDYGLRSVDDTTQKAMERIDEDLATRVKCIKIDLALVDASSTYIVPEGAVLYHVYLIITTGYSNGTGISVTVDGTTPLEIMSESDNDPKTEGLYKSQDVNVVSAANSGVVDVVVTGSPSVGAGYVLVWLAEKPEV